MGEQGVALRGRDGEWSAAFAFDTKRKAIVLVSRRQIWREQKRFYRTLIAKADLRFSEHLENLKSTKKGK